MTAQGQIYESVAHSAIIVGGREKAIRGIPLQDDGKLHMKNYSLRR